MPQSDTTMQMHIGFDDTDSTKQGCTTYVAALLVEELERLGARFLDYPLLVRLNPNVPWKTRGNGALCLRIEFDAELEEQIKQFTVELVEKHSDVCCRGTNPGIVFLKTPQIPAEVEAFAKCAVTDIMHLEDALQLIRCFNGEAYGYNSRRGIIGALSAIGTALTGDHTYELIAYRRPERFGSKRQVDTASIFHMDQALQPLTFNNVDNEKNRVIITPRGPDPILFGIRGETPQVVKEAFSMVKTLEPVDRWMIFRSNQGTDAHLKPAANLREITPYSSVIVQGVVSKEPHLVPVRHVVFAINDLQGEVDCAAYEPTGGLAKIARELMVGDCVEVYGAVKKQTPKRSLTVNLEKIRVVELAPKVVFENPLCPNCNKRLESMGRNQGLRCEKCKIRYKDMGKIQTQIQRGLKPELYVTSTRSQRHLTKPLRRYGLEKHDIKPTALIDQWHGHHETA
ncbi:MAG: tRNA(Ile)(2)-agmatinylcytidine synthase [Candidatus Bathyarchaeota archaeon]|nr:tRNA(Ile)(2)-agmatinylcytidine synthase [Candidatus Bathyarchaeota archaeon]